jgi:hypothetical protein
MIAFQAPETGETRFGEREVFGVVLGVAATDGGNSDVGARSGGGILVALKRALAASPMAYAPSRTLSAAQSFTAM